ncbi:helix-turn-helix domain-containing protein [Histidinibacterium lentulum]|uniref:Helix-turn-helix domain-containing protein n=1 Tax=Histidinibacterium lentulum TaxID=2480588 RepID=A0A3N2R9E5_9RHOB|nr:helix-turn-helix domain-containing protein [Histidinibacterium lentulum]ROU04100.1 helix-turn-helix domain-containing protein [Histidinibacterium lentulum]
MEVFWSMPERNIPPVMHRHPCPAWLHGLVAGMTGYKERSGMAAVQREPASLVVPMVISFRDAFTIALEPGPSDGDRHADFVAGLTSGPVRIGSTGNAECIQIDFTPLGALRFFGLPLSEIAAQLVPVDALLGPVGRALRDDLGATDDWPGRFALVERFLQGRFLHAPSALTEGAWTLMMRAHASLRVEQLAAELGVSRKHLSRRFQHEIGLRPKTVARILRFRRSLTTIRAAGGSTDLADIAAAGGYADQAHMTREFQALGGGTPRSLIHF